MLFNKHIALFRIRLYNNHYVITIGRMPATWGCMMMTKTGVTLALLPLAVILTGCGGGGGGANVRGAVPFTSVTAITPNSTVQLSGMSTEATYTADVNANRVTTLGTQTTRANGFTSVIAYGDNYAISTLDLTSAAGTTISLSTANRDTIGSGFTDPTTDSVATASFTSNRQDVILAAAAGNNGWNYQSYGIWETGANTGRGTSGAFSAGAATTNPVNAALTGTGTATYTGKSNGFYVNNIGSPYVTGSTLTANANFTDRTLTVSSTNTKGANNGQLFALNNLNFTGNLAYTSNSNQFTGTINTTGNQSGTLTGQFYGPTAQEIGGLFTIDPAGLERYGGAFGAKR